eukprot:TRINITY_DN7113_c0_g1_i1.p1 TRINITY_DN7113_c0_g1~~TRINITY_DN7113_c0_g1_i1.p1  ORF type:complete len:2168 (+),score=430.22 TRINITY_DN7113_c0_g1_i1:429-6506(+)
MEYAILTSTFHLLSDHLHRKNPLVIEQHAKEIMVSLLEILSSLISSLKQTLGSTQTNDSESGETSAVVSDAVAVESTSNPGYNSDSESADGESLITATDYGNSSTTTPKNSLPARLLARIPLKNRAGLSDSTSASASASASASTSTSNTNKSQAMLFRQKFICVLRSIGILAYSTPTLFHDFFGSRVTTGVPILTSLLYALSENDYGIPSDVTELALWIIKELIVVDSAYSKKLSDLHNWQLDLLKFESDRSISDTVQIQVCYSSAELLEDLREINFTARAPIRSDLAPAAIPSVDPILPLSCAILDQLLKILQSSQQQSIRDAAWYALGKIISSEALKQHLRDQVGIQKLTEIITQSGVVRDRGGFDVMLSFTCYGLRDTTGSIGHSQGVQDICSTIKSPQPGVFSRLAQTKTGFTEGGESSMASLYLTSTASVTEDSFSDDDFSELSSDFPPKSGTMLSPLISGGGGGGSGGLDFFAARGPPQPNFRFLKSRSVDSLVSLFNQSNYPKRLTSDSKYADLTKVQFRSTEVVPMLFQILETADVALQKEALKLILVLCTSNPANTKVLSRGSGLARAVQIVSSGSCKPEVQPYYFKLISLLGTYDITAKEVKMLYDIIMGKSADKVSEIISLQLLYVLANISERYQPLSYLSFSGLSGHFKLGRIDKFPLPKVGYTISCWFKLNAFLQSEQGIISWNMHDSDESVFELYIKVFPLIRLGGSQRTAKGSTRGVGAGASGGVGGGSGSGGVGVGGVGGVGGGRRRGHVRNGSNTRILSTTVDQKCGILCVQTRKNSESPYEHFSFDGYNFREWGNWHHIVLTHEPKQMVLYIDGEMIQSCNTLNYPLPASPSSTEKLTGYIGRRCVVKETGHVRSGSRGSSTNPVVVSVVQAAAAASSDPTTSKSTTTTAITGGSASQPRMENTRPLCGQVSTMHFVPGIWPVNQIQMVHSRGVLWDPNPPAFLSVRPEDYIIDSTQRESSSPAGASGGDSSEPFLSSSASGDIIRGPLVGSIQDKNSPPGVVAHSTNALQRMLSNVGGVKMPLALMDKHKAHRNVGLRILGNILRKSPDNLSEFASLGGYAYLFHVLSLYSMDITRETFEILVDILCNEDRSQGLPTGDEDEGDDEDSTLLEDDEFDDDDEDDKSKAVDEDDDEEDDDKSKADDEDEEDEEKTKNGKRKFKIVNFDILCLLLDLGKKCCKILWYEDANKMENEGANTEASMESKEEGSKEGKKRELSTSSTAIGNTTTPAISIQGPGHRLNMKIQYGSPDGEKNKDPAANSPQTANIVTRKKNKGSTPNHTLVAIRYLTRTLETLMGDERANARYLLCVEEYNNAGQKTTGLLAFLQLYASVALTRDATLRPLRRILQILLPYFEHIHMETFVNFLIGSEASDFVDASFPKAQLPFLNSRFELLKSSALQVLYNQMTSSSITVEMLRAYGTGDGGSFRALLTLLKSPEETTRLLALKMIGIFLNGNKTATAYFNRNTGFDMISLLLAPFPVTLPTLQTLLSLSLDEYCCKDPSQKTENDSFWSIFGRSDSDSAVQGQIQGSTGVGAASSVDDHSGSDSKGDFAHPEASDEYIDDEYSESDDDDDSVLIIHPEAIHAMFELIKYADNEALKTAALVNVSERLLGNSKNIEIIWKHCCWLDWCLSFLDTDSQGHPLQRSVRRGKKKDKEYSSDSSSFEESDSQQHSLNTLRQLGVFIKKMIIYELESKTARLHLLKELENEQFQGHVVEFVIDYFDKKPKLKEEKAPAIISNLVSLFKHMKGLKVLPKVYVRALDLIAKLTVNNTAEIRSIMHKLSLFELRNELICFLLSCSQVHPEGAKYLIHHFDFRSIAAHDDFRTSYGIHYLLRLFHESGQDPEYHQVVYRVLRNVFGSIESNKVFLKDLLDNDEVFESLFNKSRGAFFRWYFGDASDGVETKNELRIELEGKINKILMPFDLKLKTFLEKMRTEQEARVKKGKQRKQSNTKWQNFALLEQKRKRDENTSRETTVKMLDKAKKANEKLDATGFDRWAKWKGSDW